MPGLNLSGGPAKFSLQDSMGFEIRQPFPSENDFFRKNPNVAGMASEDNRIILNPFSSSDVNQQSVVRNEAFRLHLRKQNMTPDFAVSDEQKGAFKGTFYEKDDDALRQTIAARIFAGDPSALGTSEQEEWVKNFVFRLSESPAQGRLQ